MVVLRQLSLLVVVIEGCINVIVYLIYNYSLNMNVCVGMNLI